MKYIAIFFLAYSNLSQALGIGDISLKSYLGESLSATIMVTDVESSANTDCFTVTDISDNPAFNKAIVSLTPHNNAYQLTISTRSVVTEPIVNLRISFICEPYFQRDYILLLDPAPLLKHTLDVTAPTTLDAPTSSAQASNQNKNTLKSTTPTQAKKIKKKKYKKEVSAESVTDEKLLAAYIGKQDTAATAESRIATEPLKATAPASTDKPYLTISGGHKMLGESDSLPNLSLRLETQIDFARVEETTPTHIDAMDEVTVMANRLAYLEKQIISLQTKNALLQSETEKAKNTGLQFYTQQFQWLQYLLIIGGILVILTVAEWSRRKLLRNHLLKKQAFWFGDDKNADTSTELSASISTNNSATDNIFDDLSFGTESRNSYIGTPNTTSFTVETNEVNVNILENADVFIEHGRTALAIQLLQNHLTDYPTESPKIWLKLLGLIASEGTETEYNDAANEFKHFFNIKIPGFSDANVQNHSSIEDYPHIIGRLEGIWGSPYAVSFLNELIYNQQSEPRDGFERGPFEDLFLLKQIAETLYTSEPEEQNNLPQPNIVKPATASMALNEVAFNDTSMLSEENVTQGINSTPGQFTTDQQDIHPDSTIVNYDEEPSFFLDSAPDEGQFQTNLSTASNIKLDAPKISLNIPSESLSEDDFAQSKLATEIDFLTPTDNVFDTNQSEKNHISTDGKKTEDASLEGESTPKKTKHSNEIEWDLPKLD